MKDCEALLALRRIRVVMDHAGLKDRQELGIEIMRVLDSTHAATSAEVCEVQCEAVSSATCDHRRRTVFADGVEWCNDCGAVCKGKDPETGARVAFTLPKGLRAELKTPLVSDPLPMFLTCPICNERHIDEGEFVTKVHHTHSCQKCGLTWRPAVAPTVGVQFLPGFKSANKT